MKTLAFNLLALLIIPLVSFAPPKAATVKWGPELEGSRKSTIDATLGYDDTGYYIKCIERSGLMSVNVKIQKLTPKLTNAAVYEFEEKDPATKEKYEYEGCAYYNDKLYVFKSTTNKGDKTRSLYAEEINKTSMQSKGKPKKITDLVYTKSRNKGNFNIRMHDDKNSATGDKLLIIIDTPAEKDENEQFTLIACDNELNSIWKKDYELPYENGLFFRHSSGIDKEGNAYFLGRLYNEKVKSVRRGKQNYVYHLLAFTDNGQNKVDYEIKLKDLFITDITYRIADNGDILAGGYYSKKGTYSVDGAYYMVLDAKTKEIKTTSTKEFDIDFITQGMTEKQEERARKKDAKGDDFELYEYDLDDMIKRDDGGIVLVGEQYYVVVTTHYNGKTTTTTYTYYYNNIIIINIDNAGKIEWAQTIPKRQVSRNDGGFYSSYALMVKDNNLHFIFNDSRENLNPKKQGKVKNFTFRDKDGIVTMVTVDMTGKVTREALISSADIEVGVRPKVCEQINDHQMLIFGEKRKREQFAIVEFGE